VRDLYVLAAAGEVTVVAESSSKYTYSAEYVLSPPEELARHIISVMAMRPGDLLVALTIQAPAARYDSLKQLFAPVATSLKL
jgi:hypothetical protein